MPSVEASLTLKTQMIILISDLLARPKRFELLTPKFVVWCSIQLSYGRVFRQASRAGEPGMDPGQARKTSRKSALATRSAPDWQVSDMAAIMQACGPAMQLSVA